MRTGIPYLRKNTFLARFSRNLARFLQYLARECIILAYSCKILTIHRYLARLLCFLQEMHSFKKSCNKYIASKDLASNASTCKNFKICIILQDSCKKCIFAQLGQRLNFMYVTNDRQNLFGNDVGSYNEKIPKRFRVSFFPPPNSQYYFLKFSR